MGQGESSQREMKRGLGSGPRCSGAGGLGAWPESCGKWPAAALGFSWCWLHWKLWGILCQYHGGRLPSQNPVAPAVHQPSACGAGPFPHWCLHFPGCGFQRNLGAVRRLSDNHQENMELSCGRYQAPSQGGHVSFENLRVSLVAPMH